MSPMPSIRTFLRFGSSGVAATDHGLAGAGGFAPEVSTFFSSVTLVLPSGVLDSVVDFVLVVSSEQPEIPTQRPMAITPIIVALINFLMDASLDLGDKAAGNLT
jgi:hypothetical protein